MNNTKLIEQITKFARKHIDEFEDAGCGMYNLHINHKMHSKPKTDDGSKYEYFEDVIFQVYPYESSEYYGLMYILPYYYPNMKAKFHNDFQHDDIKFEDLSVLEQREIFSAIKKKLGFIETTPEKRDIDNLCINFNLNTTFNASDLILREESREELAKVIKEGASNDEILGKVYELEDDFSPLMNGLCSVSFGEEKPGQKDEKLELVHKMKEFLITKMDVDYDSSTMDEFEEFIGVDHECYIPNETANREEILEGICELETPSLNKLLHDSGLWDEDKQIEDATAEGIGKMVEFYHNELNGNVNLTIEGCSDSYVIGNCTSENYYEIEGYSNYVYIGNYTPIEELIDFVWETKDENHWYDTIMKALGKK